MSRKYLLKERITNEEIFPVTLTNCVIDEEGFGLDSLLTNKADVKDLSNIISQEVIDEDTFPLINELTREELKKDLFIDLWNKMCYATGWLVSPVGKYNATTGFFELNGLTDITYDEALVIFLWYNRHPYDRSVTFGGSFAYYYDVGAQGAIGGWDMPRTLFPPYTAKISSAVWVNGSYAFRGQTNIERIRLSGSASINSINALTGMFYNCSKLKVIDTEIKIGNFGVSLTDCFYGCSSLETVKISGLQNNISFAQSGKLSYTSVNHLVKNRSNSLDAFTVTLHPSVYKALIGEAEYPFNGGTQELWEELALLATEKNITFASA